MHKFFIRPCQIDFFFIDTWKKSKARQGKLILFLLKKDSVLTFSDFFGSVCIPRILLEGSHEQDKSDP